MKCIRISCQHPNHGDIGMLDHPKNEENLDYFLESFRKRGCEITVLSYDDEKKEIEI